jgi:hypothetical protein
MSSGVWTWFKKVGHWIAVGEGDINKFIQATQQSQVLTLLGPIGTAINTGIGVFEKILAGNTNVQIISNTVQEANLTNAQKLAMATPNALAALDQYASAIGMQIPAAKAAQLQTIASGIASFGADFLNLLEPVGGDKLATPATPAAPATTSAAPQAKTA